MVVVADDVLIPEIEDELLELAEATLEELVVDEVTVVLGMLELEEPELVMLELVADEVAVVVLVEEEVTVELELWTLLGAMPPTMPRMNSPTISKVAVELVEGPKVVGLEVMETGVVVAETVLEVESAFACGRVGRLDEDKVVVARTIMAFEIGMTSKIGMASTGLFWRLQKLRRRLLLPAAAHCAWGTRGQFITSWPQKQMPWLALVKVRLFSTQ